MTTLTRPFLAEPQTPPLFADADGVIRVGETRVTLDTVIAAFNEGLTAEQIVYQYPVLSLSDVYSVIGYYLKYRVKINRYLSKRQKQADKVRVEYAQQAGLREKLLARRDKA